MAIKSVRKIEDKVWLEIRQDAITHNVKALRQCLGSDVALLAVVKADGYGLGILEVSRILWESGVDFFGVSNIQEGIQLRSYLPKVPILVLGPSFLDNIEQVLDWDLIPMVSSLELLKKLNTEAMMRGKKAKVHLMIDTGMGRIGLWYEKGEPFFKELLKLEALEIQGVASHFASADQKNLEFSKLQLHRFQEFFFKLNVMGLQVPICHMANSSAVLRLPQSHLNMVRVGLMLYGVPPSPWVPRSHFRSALTWKTRIAFIKEVEPGRTISYDSTFVAHRRTKIATLPVGYAHGFDRGLSNCGEVLIRGLRFPVVGRVTMDQVMVDLGPRSEAKVGSEVVLVGSQGEEEITFGEMAEKAGTIPYEIMCRLNLRKVYV